MFTFLSALVAFARKHADAFAADLTTPDPVDVRWRMDRAARHGFTTPARTAGLTLAPSDDDEQTGR